MTARRFLPLGLVMLALALTLAACDTGRKRPPETTVRVLNVAPSFFSLDYLREETQPSNLEFRSGTVFQYDEDTYDFHIQTQDDVTGAPLRILSFPQKVVAGTTYTFVIYDTGTAIDRVVLEAPPIPATATDTEIDVLNAASGQPAMDFYLTTTNSGIVGATPVGTLAFLQEVAARRVAAGDYEITVTAAGDPSNVLLKSQSFNLPAAKYSSFVIAANEGADNNPISVVALGDTSSVFSNVLAPASLRVINSAVDQAPRDVAVDGQFSPPLFSAVPFKTKTAYASVPVSAALKINVTPPGNPGVLELDSTVPTGPTTLNTVLIGGPPGALTQVNFVEDNRRIPAVGRLQFYNSAPQILPSIDFFIVPTGTTDLTLFLPYASLLSPGGSAQLPVVPGTYDLTLRQTATTTVVAGPIPITINRGGLYGVLATNNANGVSADVTLLDDFP
ncbi:MAG TPA: DUF4397 domain-containing protein [Gammaproteobacteria bacterium]|nr:DUF4397 domain-containing protein [Gammaproteobacteria bacterium]